jgi:uncharacterized PurR-regulated membrane protein YhhQ (DUF165 family)
MLNTAFTLYVVKKLIAVLQVFFVYKHLMYIRFRTGLVPV